MNLKDHHSVHHYRLGFRVLGTIGEHRLMSFLMSSLHPTTMEALVRHTPVITTTDYHDALAFANTHIQATSDMYKLLVDVAAIAACLENNIKKAGKSLDEMINMACCHIQAALGKHYGAYEVVETKNYEHVKLRLDKNITAIIYKFIDMFVEDIKKKA